MKSPSCPQGYTDNDLKEILGDRLPEFNRWMTGQTVSVCDGTSYDHENMEYVSTSCFDNPHGIITYPWDVKQFLAGKGPLD